MKKSEQNEKKTVLTGDRPTGRLHLGHYVGSIQNRVKLQEQYKQLLLVADVQALTDNADNPEKVRSNVMEVVLDNLACGIDPTKTTIFIQSMIPEIAELTIFFLNLVTVSRLERNPTVKDEMKQKGFGSSVPAGFLMYPVSQAADILAFKTNLVPVGEDQLPMIEQTNEIVEKFNRFYGKVFEKVEPIISSTPRLRGIDGQAKMGKSLNNAIYLSDTSAVVKEKVSSMYTDQNHLRVEDPGKVDGNPVFDYLTAFDPDRRGLEDLKNNYAKGGVGDVLVKNRLVEVLNSFLSPIRDKRADMEKNMDFVSKIVKDGTEEAREIASSILKDVKRAMKINYF
ncbi:MAG: tryptophan--tRNA ligase [Candidatus Paceibacterota bacterium]|jgi:tryptophanyl-tRNA synthetase